MTTGEQLVTLSGLSGVSALAHLLGITTGSGEGETRIVHLPGAAAAIGEGAAQAGPIQFRDREVRVEVQVEKIVERIVERVVEVPTVVRVPAAIPGLPAGEAPRVTMVDGLPLLEASRPLLAVRERRIAAHEAETSRLIRQNARLAGEVEALAALFISAAAE